MRFTRYLVGGGAVAGAISALLLATGWGSAVASNVSSIFVTNTAANPVPVSGSVTVSSIGSGSTVDVGNTPNVKLDPSGNTVNVANTPTVNLAPGGNTVEVANSDASPLEVANVNDGQHPLSEGAFEELPSGGGGGCATAASPVPSGMRLVIEYVSATAPTGASDPVASFAYIQDDGQVLAPEYLAPTITGDPLQPYEVVSQQVRYYLEAGSKPRFCLLFDTGPGIDVSLFATFVGYLVKAA